MTHGGSRKGAGRKPGSKSEKVKAWEQLGDYIVGAGAERYLDIIEELPDEKFAPRYENLLEFFKPKQQRTEIKAEVTTGAKKIGIKKDASSDPNSENE